MTTDDWKALQREIFQDSLRRERAARRRKRIQYAVFWACFLLGMLAVMILRAFALS